MVVKNICQSISIEKKKCHRCDAVILALLPYHFACNKLNASYWFLSMLPWQISDASDESDDSVID